MNERDFVIQLLRDLYLSADLKGENITVFGAPVAEGEAVTAMTPEGGREIPALDAIREQHAKLCEALRPWGFNRDPIVKYHIYNNDPGSAPANYFATGYRYFLEMITNEHALNDVLNSFERAALTFSNFRVRHWNTFITIYDDAGKMVMVPDDAGTGVRPAVMTDHRVWGPFSSPADILEYYNNEMVFLKERLDFFTGRK